MDVSFAMSIYRRPGNRASLVFRRGKLLYRITTVENAAFVVNELRGYESDLVKGLAERNFVFEVLCPKNRHRVVEVGLNGQKAVLCVYEMEGELLALRFKWEGNKVVLAEVLRQFRVMAFVSRY